MNETWRTVVSCLAGAAVMFAAGVLDVKFGGWPAVWRKLRHGIHKRANKGVGGGTGADGAALAGGILGANGVAPSSTAGYSRVSLTNNTSGGAGTSLSYGLSPMSQSYPPWLSNYLAAAYSTAVLTPAEYAAAIKALMGETLTRPKPLRQMGKLTDYVIGWRSWTLAGAPIQLLFSLNARFGPWRSGQNSAVCRAMEVFGQDYHMAPDAACECGFYLRRSSLSAGITLHIPNAWLGDLTTVLGAVRCWGRIIEHGTEGFRAEHAEIVALLDSGEHARAAAKRYGVPCLSAERIESYAYEFGRALPGPDAEA